MNYRIFNTVCVVLGLGFLAGSVYFVYGSVRYEINWTDSIKQIADSATVNLTPNTNSQTSNIDLENGNSTTIEQFNNLTIKPLNNSVVSSTQNKINDILPQQYLLSIPFTSQAPEKNWAEPWQDACEEASLLMLDAYYKGYNLSPLFARDEILKMVAWEEQKRWGTSISITDIKLMAEDYFHLNKNTENTKTQKQLNNETIKQYNNRTIRIIENPTIEQIKKSIANKNPVLVVADGKVLPNPHFQNGGPDYHALIIRGYDEENFITNDPGTQFGENFKYKYNDLINAIHDWNNEDVAQGKRVVMMIESSGQ